MKLSVTDAKARLTDLVRRAQAGEEVLLTRHGHPVARLVATHPKLDRRARREFMEAISLAASAKVVDGVSAAKSQDFLYDEAGLPG